MLLVCIKYSIFHLICDVISWSCDIGKINVYDKIMILKAGNITVTLKTAQSVCNILFRQKLGAALELKNSCFDWHKINIFGLLAALHRKKENMEIKEIFT